LPQKPLIDGLFCGSTFTADAFSLEEFSKSISLNRYLDDLAGIGGGQQY
jgi:hypothetical protein